MPKYSNPKQIISREVSDTNPTAPEKDKDATGLWWGSKHYPGKFVTYYYADGTVETRFFYDGQGAGGEDPQHPGVVIENPFFDREQHDAWLEDQQGAKGRTPEAEERDRQIVRKGARDELQAERDENERQYNSTHGGRYETHEERADRESKELQRSRDDERLAMSQRAEQRQIASQEESNRQSQQRYELDVRRFEADQAKPSFLSQAGESNPYLVHYNPQTNKVEQLDNPNYDRVKVEGERLRQQLSTQIQARQMTLEEGKQQYQQWFDQNVKIPLMQSQEARDRAAEQRAALDAEERRAQFAANFGLQKASLGQRAGEAAMQAEQSLLPYRAGPTEAAEMSSAINSLAQGGSMDKNASAGINFTPSAFQFQAPDFKKIASDAASSALKGLTDYKPAKGSYQTADYSGVPSVDASGAPGVPQGYGDFQGLIDQMNSLYQYGGK